MIQRLSIIKAYVRDKNGNYIFGSKRKFTTAAESQIEPQISVTLGAAIDLGLPSDTKWASCNIGANSPEYYGCYFAYGETEEKPSNNNSTTYKLSYWDLLSLGIIDNDGNLTANYDAATVNLGNSWRMPTYLEIRELIDNCTWIWGTLNGASGYQIVGCNGKSIFLPIIGYYYSNSYFYNGAGYYWCSTTYSNEHSYYLFLNSDEYALRDDEIYRDYGMPLRPVLKQ